MTKIYIPKDLDDCFVELKKILKPEDIDEIKNKEVDGMVIYHHRIGRYLRNTWGLWAGSCLSKWFKALGIRHPDDMSNIIITSFWRHLNSKPIEIDDQIKYYQKYWGRISKPTFKPEQKND